MLVREIRDIKNTPSELRKFGITMAAALAVIGAYLLWRQKACYPYLFAVAALFLFAGLLVSSALKPVHRAWMTFALIMGWVMTRVVLAILFYLVITPTGLLMRLLGKDLINVKFDKGSAASYWIARQIEPRQRDDYERQF